MSRIVSAAALLAMCGQAMAQCGNLDKFTQGVGSAFNDLFGASLSMSHGGPSLSPLCAVGMPNEDAPSAGLDAGGFTVYQKINGWSQLAGNWNTTGQAGERAGWSIGLSDPYLISGAPGYNSWQGRARVYTRSGTSFLHSTDLMAGIGSVGDEFGDAVAISGYGGGWAVVGAPFHNFHGLSDSGAAFFFIRSAGGAWTQELQIWGGDFAADHNEHTGEAVAMSQNSEYAAVGSPNGESSGQPADHGIVHIVARLANGLPSPQAHLAAPTPQGEEHFGAAVAIEGTRLVVGAPDNDAPPGIGGLTPRADAGSVYIFERGASTWGYVTMLRAPSAVSNGRFGSRVALSGDQILVSEPLNKRVYAFTKVGTDWVHQATFTDPDGAASGDFGSAIGIRNGDIFIGDDADDHDTYSDAGAAYALNLGATTLTGDSCSDPIQITSTADIDGCTEFATPSGGTGTTSCGNGGTGNDVWYRFTPTCDGNAIFDTYGSGFDTVLSVHTGCPNLLGNGSITCNDDANFAAPYNRCSLVTFNFTGGQTYLIRISGYNGANGAYTLRHSEYYSVSNDTCATASTMGLGTASFNTCSATNTALSTCVGNFYKDVWYRFIAPSADRYNFSTCGSSFDTVMALYNGTQQNCPTNATPVLACSDDTTNICGVGSSYQSQFVKSLAAGQSVLLRVGGYNGDDFGAGTLSISHFCPADFDNGNGQGVPDGGVGIEDLLYYLSIYDMGVVAADVDDGSNTGTQDGGVGIEDLLFFLSRYEAGC